MAAESTLVIRGTFIHAPEYGKLEVLEDKVLAVRVGDETSSILAIVDGATEEQLLQSHGLSNESVIRLGEQEFMIPGFIDTHIHAPQYMFAGTGNNR